MLHSSGRFSRKRILFGSTSESSRGLALFLAASVDDFFATFSSMEEWSVVDVTLAAIVVVEAVASSPFLFPFGFHVPSILAVTSDFALAYDSR